MIERYEPRAVVLCCGAEAATTAPTPFPPTTPTDRRCPTSSRASGATRPPSSRRSAGRIASDGDLEADDLLGSFAELEADAGGEALLFTGDRDMFQCVGDARHRPVSGGGKDGPEVVDPDGVRERYGIEPEQVPDFIALRGDPSDGLPGAKGIGAKTARDLLRATARSKASSRRRRSPVP